MACIILYYYVSSTPMHAFPFCIQNFCIPTFYLSESLAI